MPRCEMAAKGQQEAWHSALLPAIFPPGPGAKLAKDTGSASYVTLTNHTHNLHRDPSNNWLKRPLKLFFQHKIMFKKHKYM